MITVAINNTSGTVIVALPLIIDPEVLVYEVVMLYVFGAGATTMCVRNDKVVFGASSQQVPTVLAYDADSAEWSVYFDEVGVVSGVASMSPFGVDRTRCTNDNGRALFKLLGGCPYAEGADANKNYQGRNDGGNCWCKITHPFESKWVNIGSSGISCVKACADKGMVQNYETFRPSIFATVGMGE